MNNHLRNLTEEESNSYPKCMEALTIEDRRTLLDPFLKDAKVNWANLAIASLLKPNDNDQCGYIKRLLTFNFDNVLARACGICGYYPATYDFSQTPPKDFDFMSDGAITHLHGQGSGLKMLNSGSETNPQANALGNLFTDTLAKYNLVIIGYSGLADNAFKEFQKRFENRTRIFWIGYSDEPQEHIKKLQKKAPKTFSYFGGADADKFLIDLAIEIGCWPPKIFSNPYGHLLDELNPVIEYPEDAGEDILSKLRTKLKEKESENVASSSNLNDLLFQGKFEEIIEQTTNPTTDEQKYARSWAFTSIGNDLYEKAQISNDEAFYNQAFEKYEEALKIDPNNAAAYNNWGSALLNLARLKNDEVLYKLSFEKYDVALKINPEDAVVYYNWGNAVSDLAKLKNDEALYKISFEKYELALKIAPEDSGVYYNWGNALLDLARLKNDEAIYKQAIEKYETAHKIDQEDACTYSNWGNALSDLAELKNDEALYELSFEKYEAVLKIVPDNASAYINFGVSLSSLSKLKKDAALYKQAIEKYETALVIDPENADAYTSWGVALSELAELKNDETLYKLAIEKCEQAQKLTSKADYNLACIYSQMKKFEDCERQLLKCKTDGTLPSLAHLNTDTDMDNVRDKKWFKDLISSMSN